MSSEERSARPGLLESEAERRSGGAGTGEAERRSGGAGTGEAEHRSGGAGTGEAEHHFPYVHVPEELKPPEPPEDLPPVRNKIIVPRWVQLVSVPLLALLGWELLRVAKHVVLLLIIASAIALILNPLVELLSRRLPRRGLAVLGVYLAFFLIVAGIGLLLASPISHQVTAFAKDVPHLTNEANKRLADAQAYLNKHGIGIHFIKQGKTALQTVQEKLIKGSSSIASFGGSLLAKIASAAFDLVLIFVLSVYLLLYGPRIGALVRRMMPPGDGSEEDDYPSRVQRAVSAYVRGQLLFSLTMGASAGVALYIFGLIGIFPNGKTYAVAFGAFYAVVELIPYVGPVLGAIPPVLVALFSDPISALWVALLFVALQQLEGHIVAPQIFGHSLRINPILVILSLLVGAAIYGLVGALIALPVVAVIRETIIYLHRHLELEPWDRSKPLL